MFRLVRKFLGVAVVLLCLFSILHYVPYTLKYTNSEASESQSWTYERTELLQLGYGYSKYIDVTKLWGKWYSN